MSNIKSVTKFETPDGKVFTNIVEAEGHVEYLSIGGAIEAFTTALGLGPAESTRAKKYISGYSAFVKTYTGPMAAPAPVESPAPAAAANDAQVDGEQQAA